MKLIDSIWSKIVEIERRSFDRPTHIEVPRRMIPVLVSEYSELSDIQYELEDIPLKRNYTIFDVEDYFGNVTFTISLRDSNDIKVLKEITSRPQ